MTTHGPRLPIQQAGSKFPLTLEGFFAGERAPLQNIWEVDALNLRGDSALVHRVGCDTVRIANLVESVNQGTPPSGYGIQIIEPHNPDAPELDVLYTGEVH